MADVSHDLGEASDKPRPLDAENGFDGLVGFGIFHGSRLARRLGNVDIRNRPMRSVGAPAAGIGPLPRRLLA
jgi:hypothetical protein